MKKITRNYFLVKYAEGCYMGKQHNTSESAFEHIENLKIDKDEKYRSRSYEVVHIIITETEEVITQP